MQHNEANPLNTTLTFSKENGSSSSDENGILFDNFDNDLSSADYRDLSF